MQKIVEYTIFKTKWGYFGLACNKNRLCRTQLPCRELKIAESRLLKGIREASYNKRLLSSLQWQITAYFQGSYINTFGLDIDIELRGLSDFAAGVLTACRTINFAKTISYSQLAKRAGRPPTSARAVGGVLAKNPLPLIIPCHRVIRSDGNVGGFTAVNGISLKKRMLKLEQSALTPTK